MALGKETVSAANDLDPADVEKLYVWDPEFYEKIYEIPKFREKIETKIKEFQEILSEFKENNQINEFKSQRKTFKAKIVALLEKPNELYNKISDDFDQQIETINQYYDYLDTNERKFIENFKDKISKYYEILNILNKKAELNMNA